VTEHKTIGAALAAAARELDPPAKSGTNAFHRYSYTTAEEMLDAVRIPLARNGLCAVMVRQALGEPMPLGGKHKDGADRIGYRVAYTMRLMWSGGESMDSEIEYVAYPEPGRPIDKALNAAATNSLAYWLRSLLMVPRGLGESVDERGDAGGERPQAPSKPPSKPPQIIVELRQAMRDRGVSTVQHATHVLRSLGAEADTLDEIGPTNAAKVVAALLALDAGGLAALDLYAPGGAK